MPISGDKHLHSDVVVVDRELDHLAYDGAVLSPAPSRLLAIGGTACTDQTQKPQDEWKLINPAFTIDLEVFGAFFNPIPLIPFQTLDFEKHEIFLKQLGLWDFIHLDYDYEIRADLLRQLVLNFDPTVGFSTVDGIPIEISRMAIACALKLPVRQVEIDYQLGVKGSELIEFFEGFVVNWMILHEDAWVMREAMEWMRLIREGKFDKVDWAGLMWFMMESELLYHVWKLGSCYYASYFQCLIKFQQPGLFEERAMVEDNGKKEQGMGYAEVIILNDDDDDEQDVGDANIIYELDVDDDDDDNANMIKLYADDEQDVGDVKMIKLDDEGKSSSARHDDDYKDDDNNSDNKHDAADCDDNIQELEGQNAGLLLELGKIETDEVGVVDVLNLNQCKEAGPEYPLPNRMDGSERHFMKQCNQNKIWGIAFQSEGKAEVGGLASENGVQDIGTENLLFNSSIYDPDHFTEEPLASRAHTCVNAEDPFMSNNSLKPRLASENGVQDIGTETLLFNSSIYDPDHFTEESLASGAHTCVNVDDLFMSNNSLKPQLASENGVQDIGREILLFNSSIYDPDHFTEEPLVSGAHTCVNVDDLFISNNSLKRRLEHQNESDFLCSNYHNKRTKTDDSSCHASLDFDCCTDQTQFWMDEARMAYIERERLLKALKQQERMNEHLERTKREEIHKRDVEVHNLTRELQLMKNVMDGYKSTLRKTQKLFSTYRERCQLREKPLYRDGVSTGGVRSYNHPLAERRGRKCYREK